MKFSLQTLSALAFTALLSSAALAETTCEKVAEAQFEETSDGEEVLRPESNLALDAYFVSGYVEVQDTFERHCMIMNDGTLYLFQGKGMKELPDGNYRWNKSSCKKKKLRPSTVQALLDLQDTVRSQPVITKEYGICDGPSYGIALREGNRLTAIDTVEDCGNRMNRVSKEAKLLKEMVLDLCQSKRHYREWSRFISDMND